MTTPAVVIGDMDLIRPLGLAGIPCIAAGPTGPETGWSRYSIRSMRLPDLWQEADSFVESLLELGRSVDEKPVLFYQKDPAALMLARHRETLAEYFRFVLPTSELVEDLVDKRRFQRRCAELRIPVPGTLFATVGMDTPPRTAVRYPVIVKPVIRDRLEETWLPVAHGAKALVMSTRTDLERLWARPELAGVPLVVQEYIPGDESTLVSYHSYISGGSVVGEFTGRKIRTRPREFGISTAVVIEDIPEAKRLGRSVLERLGLEGVAKIDMKVAPDGSLHVLEVNPRFNLWHHPGALAGVNLPLLVHRRLTEGHVEPAPPAKSGIRWVQVWGDFSMARAAGVPMGDWLRSVQGAQARRAAHLDDPGAMLGAAAWAAIKAARRLGGRAPRAHVGPEEL